MIKRLLVIVLCLALVLSFAACKKDEEKDNTPPSSTPVSSDPTQDYDKDAFDEGEDLTDEEKEELEDLWNELVQNGGADISTPSTDTPSTNTPSTDTPSGGSSGDETPSGSDGPSESTSSDSTSSSGTSNNQMGNSNAEIVPGSPSL